ncbi:MAG: hypothetical protein M3410_05090 [Acidobacteriota bacterium]|nr:hypothetical protein [Acidobacteriota bacterium]
MKARFLLVIKIEVENRNGSTADYRASPETPDHSRGKDFPSTMFAMDFDWQRILLCIALMRGCPPRVA